MPTTLEHIQYGFDRDGRRTWQKRPLTSLQDQAYQYDALSQVSAASRGSLNTNLTAISGIPSLEEGWNYDPTGNWRGYHSAVAGASPLDQQRVHDRGNRLTQIEDNPNNMILDRVGRMRQLAPDAGGDWDGKLEITWDAWSRITQVTNNDEVVGSYCYDGSHRRVTRAVSGETLHSFYNDAWRPVEERKDSETSAALSYLWGSRHRDDLVRRDRAVGGTTLNETRYVLMDYFNPAALTDDTGVVTERYQFSAFGLRTILNPDFTVRSDSECAFEFGFQGQFLDVESGLMNYGYRYYSPYLGRWTCKDPIGERGGVNLYLFSRNCATNYVDKYGLEIGGSEGPCQSGNIKGGASVYIGFGGNFDIGGSFKKCCCPDKSKNAWEGTVFVKGNVGVGLAGVADIPLLGRVGAGAKMTVLGGEWKVLEFVIPCGDASKSVRQQLEIGLDMGPVFSLGVGLFSGEWNHSNVKATFRFVTEFYVDGGVVTHYLEFESSGTDGGGEFGPGPFQIEVEGKPTPRFNAEKKEIYRVTSRPFS